MQVGTSKGDISKVDCSVDLSVQAHCLCTAVSDDDDALKLCCETCVYEACINVEGCGCSVGFNGCRAGGLERAHLEGSGDYGAELSANHSG